MKKTKLLTSITALALVLGLGACETNININGDVNVDADVSIGGNDSETSGSDSSEDTTTSDTEIGGETGTGEGGLPSDSSDSDSHGASEEDLKISQDIVDAVSAISSSGYQSFDYLDYYSVVGQGGAQKTFNTYSITLDSNNKIYGLRRIYDEDSTKESDAKFHYLVEGVDYYYNGSLPSPSYTYSNLSYNTFNTLLSANVGSGYNGAFSNASSLDVSQATDLDLTVEDNGNYKLTFKEDDVWYCYKATTSYDIVGAGYYTGLDLGDYASTSGYEFAYGELATQERIDKVMESFDITLWIPETSGEEQTNAEKALEFIESVEAKTENLTNISWDAFHYYDGEAGGLSDDENSEEGWLTTQNGNLYGYIDEINDEDLEEYHTYYQNGVKFYDNDGSKSYSETYNETYDGLLDTQLDNAYEVFEVLEDALEDAEEDDIVLTTSTSGSTLTINTTTGNSDAYGGGTSATTTYVLASDASYNLTKISSEKEEEDTYTVGASQQTFTTTTKYLLEKKNVGEIALPDDFDPTDFGYTAPENPNTGEPTVADVIDVLNTIGGAYNYGDGFYYESIDYSLYGYTDTLINATSDNYGLLEQTDYNFDGDGSTVTYSSFMGAYSNGSTTYVNSDGEVADAGELAYDYDIFQLYTLLYFAYMDYYEILDQLGDWANHTDFTNDIELEDGEISLMGYDEDITNAVMLFASYDEDGFNYFIYQYQTETSAYAVMLYPETSVETPSWLS